MIVRLTLASMALLTLAGVCRAEPWERHTIDDSSKGADGVRLADANGDGLMDIATGWEEGGVIRVYLNPGPGKAKNRWPAVTVGEVAKPEDAVLVDLDGDGAMDVVSSCEGDVMTIYVHWAPADKAKYLDADAWVTEPIPATVDVTRWMYAAPLQVDGERGVDLVVGSKNPGGMVGWLQSPENPRDLDAWVLHSIADAGWIMSLELADFNEDGVDDVIVSDRKGPARGVYWLNTPGKVGMEQGFGFTRQPIGGEKNEVMFLEAIYREGMQFPSVVAATRNGRILAFTLTGSTTRGGRPWRRFAIDNPYGIQHGKAVRRADIDLDGRPDFIVTANTGDASPGAGERPPGVSWLKRARRGFEARDISGDRSVKFDRIELLDLDDDGDLDVLTCEERHNLGVIWYENPTLPKQPAEEAKD